jgi:uncharacterized surface protein with fasciclin (FAS1) repeats
MTNLVDIAKNLNDFTTLVNAVRATQLVEILSKSGPFTIFAPNDEAFAKLPLETVTNLWLNLPKFKYFLSYHVVPGKLMQADLKNIAAVASVEGSLLPIDFHNGFKVNHISVIAADLEADNGVIHVIDNVLVFQTQRSATVLENSPLISGSRP